MFFAKNMVQSKENKMLHKIKEFIKEKQSENFVESAEQKAEKIKASVAAILLEIAYCDDDFSDDERIRVTAILKEKFDLNDEETEELIKTGQKERDQSVDLWHFTKMINENYSKKEKIDVIEMLWRVVYADSVLHSHEDYLIHKLSTLLRLDHKEFIGAKLRAESSKP